MKTAAKASSGKPRKAPESTSKVLRKFPCRCFLVPYAFFCFLWLPLHAESFAVTMTPERSTGTLAEPLTIAVESRHPEGYALGTGLKDLKEQKTGPFEVTGLEIEGPGKAKLTVIAFDTGPLTFPGLEWTLIPAKEGGEARKIKSPPVRLEISGPELGPDSDIKDIKPILTLFHWSRLLAALALAGVLLYLFRKWRSRIVPRILGPSEPQKTPDELALDKIRELLASGLWEQGRHKLFYFRLCDIVREYLEARYRIPCMYLTTLELFRQMREAEIERSICLKTKEFMEGCDLVKFAKFVPSDPEKEKDLEAAQTVILASAPKKEEPVAG